MSASRILRKAAVGLGALAVPVVFAVAGAGQASADNGPGACVSGPFGYASACLNWPGWVDWGVPYWDGWHDGWHGGHGGDGDSQGGD